MNICVKCKHTLKHVKLHYFLFSEFFSDHHFVAADHYYVTATCTYKVPVQPLLMLFDSVIQVYSANRSSLYKSIEFSASKVIVSVMSEIPILCKRSAIQ